MAVMSLYAEQPAGSGGWTQWLLVGFSTLVVAAISAWCWHNARRVEQERGLCWFQLVAPQSHLLEPSAPLEVNVERLLRGLCLQQSEGLPVRAVTLAHASGFSVGPEARLLEGTSIGSTVPAVSAVSRAGGTASLRHRLFVAVPEAYSGRLPIAAAGCGVQALPVTEQLAAQCNSASGVDLAVNDGSAAPSVLSVPAEPGWFVGMDSFGQAVTIHPVPGSTIVLRAETRHATGLLRRIPWPAALFSAIDATSPENPTTADWADRWSPGRVRCVAIPAPEDPTRARWQSCDLELLESVADLTVDCSPAGDRAVLTVGSRKVDVRLRPAGRRGEHRAGRAQDRRYKHAQRFDGSSGPGWSGSSRTARVSSARSASLLSSG